MANSIRWVDPMCRCNRFHIDCSHKSDVSNKLPQKTEYFVYMTVTLVAVASWKTFLHKSACSDFESRWTWAAFTQTDERTTVTHTVAAEASEESARVAACLAVECKQFGLGCQKALSRSLQTSGKRACRRRARAEPNERERTGENRPNWRIERGRIHLYWANGCSRAAHRRDSQRPICNIQLISLVDREREWAIPGIARVQSTTAQVSRRKYCSIVTHESALFLFVSSLFRFIFYTKRLQIIKYSC